MNKTRLTASYHFQTNKRHLRRQIQSSIIFLRKNCLKERSVDIVLFVVTEAEIQIYCFLYDPTFILMQVYST